MVRYNRYYQYASDLCVRLPAWTLFLCFRPHLLVHNDTAPIPQQALEGVSCRMEMLYSDSMDARVMADGMVS